MLTWVDLLALMVLALSLALGYRGGLVLAWVGLLGLPRNEAYRLALEEEEG